MIMRRASCIISENSIANVKELRASEAGVEGEFDPISTDRREIRPTSSRRDKFRQAFSLRFVYFNRASYKYIFTAYRRRQGTSRVATPGFNILVVCESKCCSELSRVFLGKLQCFIYFSSYIKITSSYDREFLVYFL
jgi:hypothetical protein